MDYFIITCQPWTSESDVKQGGPLMFSPGPSRLLSTGDVWINYIMMKKKLSKLLNKYICLISIGSPDWDSRHGIDKKKSMDHETNYQPILLQNGQKSPNYKYCS